MSGQPSSKTTFALPHGQGTYQLRRSPRRRRLALQMSQERGLVVYAPLAHPQRHIDAFLQEKARWIAKQQARIAALPLKIERRYACGETFFFLGEAYQLKRVPLPTTELPTIQRTRSTVTLVARLGGPRELCVRFAPDAADHGQADAHRETVRRAVEKWYRAQAIRYFREPLARYAARLGLPPPPLAIGHQRKRWGSCSAKGTIRLNLRLMMAAPVLIDYVAAHEVCHLRVFDHSPRFWTLLGQLIPDYPARKRRLQASENILCL